VVDGEKIFITSGMRADWITVAVRTGEAGSKGAGGISLLLVPGDSKGLSRTRLDKMGWLCSDTAHLRFDGMRVPARYLLGGEGAGFRAIMGNFNGERIGIAAGALGFAEACYDEALSWARQRQTFGSALTGHQVIRHRLVDMQQRIRATAAWLEQLAARADSGDLGADWIGEISTLKNQATQTLQFCADAGVQILGGMGYMRGTVCERIYREVKVITVGGGTEEIMKELAAKQWGIV
jgi:acyl-CoA dehydrogenase